MNPNESILKPIHIENSLVTLQNTSEEDNLSGVGCSTYIEALRLIIQGERKINRNRRNARVMLKNCLNGETEGIVWCIILDKGYEASGISLTLSNLRIFIC